jgi:hypothetical protein
LTKRQRRGWWEEITTEDGLPPPEVLTYDEYTFQFMGVENEEERLGIAESGKSATTNLKSPGNQSSDGLFLTLLLLSGYQHWKDRRWQKFIRLH